MIILGLTGSIGMGKSVTANMFRQFGIPVHDADKAVHELMAPGGAAVQEIAKLFPMAMANDKINRNLLGDIVFGNKEHLHDLEAIIHPIVRKQKQQFLEFSSRRRCSMVVLDVPLLFETGGHKNCDGVVVVSAPIFVQRARVMARPGMTVGKFESILDKQLPDREKCLRADFVVQTGIGRLESLSSIRNIIAQVKTWKGNHWPPTPIRFRHWQN